MSQLLSVPQAFDWQNANLNRSMPIRNFQAAYDLAKKNGDRLFYHPELYHEGTPSLDLFNIVWAGYDALKAKFPWIELDDFNVLVAMHYEFQPSTGDSRTLDELERNTGDEHNSWIAPHFDWHHAYVYDEVTFNAFHGVRVISFTRAQRLANPKYFKKYFVPELLLPLQTISDRIYQGQYNPAIERIDRPTQGPNGVPQHGEQIHVHFTNGAALNINGTWKHGFLDLQAEVCETLISWGFMLPENN